MYTVPHFHSLQQLIAEGESRVSGGKGGNLGTEVLRLTADRSNTLFLFQFNHAWNKRNVCARDGQLDVLREPLLTIPIIMYQV